MSSDEEGEDEADYESSESMQDIDKKAKVYQEMQGQEEIDEDSELDAALNTIKSNEKKQTDSKSSAKTNKSEKNKAQAVLT